MSPNLYRPCLPTNQTAVCDTNLLHAIIVSGLFGRKVWVRNCAFVLFERLAYPQLRPKTRQQQTVYSTPRLCIELTRLISSLHTPKRLEAKRASMFATGVKTLLYGSIIFY